MVGRAVRLPSDVQTEESLPRVDHFEDGVAGGDTKRVVSLSPTGNEPATLQLAAVHEETGPVVQDALRLER